jgi:hypothetical protein
MRLLTVVLACVCLVGCQRLDWPPVPASESVSELTSNDLGVISAALNGILLSGNRNRGTPGGPAASPVPTVVLADRTIRICEPHEFDSECVPPRDVLAGFAHDRNRRAFRITEAPPGVRLAPVEEVTVWVLERGWRDRFQSRYPGHWGPVFVTAPVCLKGGKALLYVSHYGHT